MNYFVAKDLFLPLVFDHATNFFIILSIFLVQENLLSYTYQSEMYPIVLLPAACLFYQRNIFLYKTLKWM